LVWQCQLLGSIAMNTQQIINKIIDHSLFRTLCFFSLALLGSTVFTFVAWSILSVYIYIPTSEEIATALGMISAQSGWVQPEPAENYTFFLSTGVAIFLFGLAGYRSVVDLSRPGPVAKLGFVLAVLGLLTWLILMRWDSIVPPPENLSILIKVSIGHPWIFFGLGIFMSTLVLFVAKLEPFKKWRFMPLVLSLMPLLVLSRMVLISNDDGYVNTTHYEVFVFPLIQDWLNSGIHLTQKSQYGMYPIFLRPLWFFAGAPTTVAVSFVMSVLLFMSNIAMVTFMYRFSQNKTMATVFGLFGIIFSLLFYPFWPGDAYFEFFPVRLIFPALSMMFILLPLTRLHYPWVAYAVLAFGLAWNFESGLIGLIMFGVFSIALRFVPKWSAFNLLCIKHLAMSLAAITFSVFCLIYYYLYRFGAAPDFGGVLTMIKAFSAGVGAVPMPMFGVWIFHALIYGASIIVGIRWLFLSQHGHRREQAAALLALTAMGLLWLRYYQGRSMPLPLTFATFPAIFCLGILMDAIVSSLPRYQKLASRSMAIVIGGPLLASLFLWAGNDPVPQRQFDSFINEKDSARLNLVVNQVLKEYSLYKRHANDRLLVVAPYAHLVQLKLKVPNPINVAGMCQFWFESEIEDLVLALNDPTTRVVVFDRNNICPMNGVLTHPRVESLLSSKFNLVPKIEGCSFSHQENMKMFVSTRYQGTNVALGKPAVQSSEYGYLGASVAVDGNTDGRWAESTTTHTNLQSSPWWEVDLGSAVAVDSIEVWNRTDAFSDRLSAYWVFTSEKPFLPTDTLETLRARTDVFSNYQESAPCPVTTVRVNKSARFVRIQLQSKDYLSLAEVRVLSY
jgi:hypothetical protein